MSHSTVQPAGTGNGIVEGDHGREPDVATYPTFTKTFICINSLALIFWLVLWQPSLLRGPLFVLSLVHLGPIGWFLVPIVIALAFLPALLLALVIFFIGLYVPAVMSFDYGTLYRGKLFLWTAAASGFAFWLLSIQMRPNAGGLQWIAATGLALQFSLIPGLVYALADCRKERQPHAR